MVGVRRWLDRGRVDRGRVDRGQLGRLDRFRLERGGWVEERRRVDDEGIGLNVD